MRSDIHLGVRHPLRDEHDTDRDTGDEITCQPPEIWTNERRADRSVTDILYLVIHPKIGNRLMR